MNFIEIGKRAKTTTRDYDDLSDYEAGQAYALVYLKDDLHLIEDNPIEVLPALPELSVKTDAHAFLGWRGSHIGNQIAFLNVQYGKAHAIRQAQFDHSVVDERISRAYYLEKAQYVVNVLNSRAQAQDLVASQQLTNEALKYGFDKVSYLVFRLRQIDTDEQLRLRGEQFRQDQQNKEELARIERENAAKSASDKIAAATQAKLARLQQERAIKQELDRAIMEAHDIKIGSASDNVKQRRLSAQEEFIASLQRQLDELRRVPGKDDSGQDT